MELFSLQRMRNSVKWLSILGLKKVEEILMVLIIYWLVSGTTDHFAVLGTSCLKHTYPCICGQLPAAVFPISHIDNKGDHVTHDLFPYWKTWILNLSYRWLKAQEKKTTSSILWYKSHGCCHANVFRSSSGDYLSID